MEIKVARSAGFCFGVKLAVDRTEELIEKLAGFVSDQDARILRRQVYTTNRIKASDLASRSEGIGFEECLDTDGGIIPNYTQDGKALTYKIDVTQSDIFTFNFRVSTENRNSSFKIYVDDKLVGQFRWVEGSGGWQNWVTKETAVDADLTKGEHTIKFVFATAVNINWFELVG